MDFADRAEIETERAEQLAAEVRKPAGPAPTGYCLYCGEPLAYRPVGLQPRWCDAECRDAWERRHS